MLREASLCAICSYRGGAHECRDESISVPTYERSRHVTFTTSRPARVQRLEMTGEEGVRAAQVISDSG